MYSEKSKNENRPRRTFKQGLFVGLLIGVVATVAFVAWLNASTVRGGSYPETLIVPFDRADVTWTQTRYNCYVYLKIEGTGQAAGNDFSDAFYQYTQNGQPLETPLTHQFDLEIDGNRAIITLGLEDNPPLYNPEHIYEVRYRIESPARQIGFRISDLIVGDNNGQFMITISQVAWGCG